MKQTAVEWLVNELNNRNWNIDFYKSDIKSLIEQAKEMEKQQQGYSEEEVLEIIEATLIEYSDFVLADIPEWFEQFKKK